MNVALFESDGVTHLTHFTQWDTNREIIIRGLEVETAPVCQFYNVHSKKALVVGTTIDDGDITVPVPNLILQEGLSIIIDVYDESGTNTTTFDVPPQGGEGKVVWSFRIPVNPKPQPEDYEYTENIGYVSWVELSRRAEALIAKLENTDFRRNSDTQFVEFTIDGVTWNNLFNLSEIKGDAATIISATGSVDGEYGDPYVDVVLGGTSNKRSFDFQFHNISGFSPTAEVTADENSITITMEDINGRTSQSLGRYASFLPVFDIDPLTGKLYMTTVSGYYDMEFYITESNGHLNVREAE